MVRGTSFEREQIKESKRVLNVSTGKKRGGEREVITKKRDRKKKKGDSRRGVRLSKGRRVDQRSSNCPLSPMEKGRVGWGGFKKRYPSRGKTGNAPTRKITPSGRLLAKKNYGEGSHGGKRGGKKVRRTPWERAIHVTKDFFHRRGENMGENYREKKILLGMQSHFGGEG